MYTQCTFENVAIFRACVISEPVGFGEYLKFVSVGMPRCSIDFEVWWDQWIL